MTCEIEVENNANNVAMWKALRDYMTQRRISEREAIGLASVVMNHGGRLVLRDAWGICSIQYRDYTVDREDLCWCYYHNGDLNWNGSRNTLRDALTAIDEQIEHEALNEQPETSNE